MKPLTFVMILIAVAGGFAGHLSRVCPPEARAASAEAGDAADEGNAFRHERNTARRYADAAPVGARPSAERESDGAGNGPRTVAGRLSATEERARRDARLILEREVSDWVYPDVPRGWKVPAGLIDPMVGAVRIRAIEKDYGTLYEAAQRVDFSPEARARIVETYERELVLRRLAFLGGLFAFLLTCLGALSGYIRADEATKGYYTNRLRVAAAAGVGASGVLIYQLLS